MPIKADYHLHSSFSGDCDAPMEEMIRAAVSLGHTGICFTEHMEIDYPVTPDAPKDTFTLNTDSYLFDLIRLREKYQDQIRVCFGVELGMQPSITRRLAQYARAYDFDFIIASTHVVKGLDPYYPSYFEGRSDEEAYRAYFEEELHCMKSFTNFDVYGHIDYVTRYGQSKDSAYSYDKYSDLFDQMIDTLLDAEKGIEINTGGFRRGMREMHPCTEFLRRYRKKGGEIITVGSDAHFPQHLGADFAKAAELLTDCGFTHYCTFEKRVPTFHRI